MKLTITDIYKQRKDIINFAKNLFEDLKKSDYTNQTIKYKELTGSFCVAASNGKKQNYLDDFKHLVESTRAEYASHMVGLDVYHLMLEEHKGLLDANPNQKNNPILIESKRNIDILKAQLIKQGIPASEFEMVEQNSKELESMVYEHVIKKHNEKLENLAEQYGANVRITNEYIYEDRMKDIIDFNNLTDFYPSGMTNNSRFYSSIKNTTYIYANNFDCKCEETKKIEKMKIASGYVLDDGGMMVADKSGGFFTRVANLFCRLIGFFDARNYNRTVSEAITGFDNAEAVSSTKQEAVKENVIVLDSDENNNNLMVEQKENILENKAEEAECEYENKGFGALEF